jgi:hypothetical protein
MLLLVDIDKLKKDMLRFIDKSLPSCGLIYRVKPRGKCSRCQHTGYLWEW